jgi:uncharacterized metal-binding protein YceD (DUF177 family)
MTPNPLQSPWIIPLESVRSAGLKRQEVLSEGATLSQIAKDLHILRLNHLEYDALITREKEGLRVVGKLKAKLEQACSLTLEPVLETVSEEFDITFLPDAPDPAEVFEMPEDIEAFLASEDPPEPLINNQVNLYEILCEFIALGLNPFPRKEGAVFINPQEESGISPFAALAQLKSKS